MKPPDLIRRQEICAIRRPLMEERTMIIAGLDPGCTGAIAYLWDTGALAVEDLPQLNDALDVAVFLDSLAAMRPALVVVERQSARPGMGVASMFRLGLSYGLARAA